MKRSGISRKTPLKRTALKTGGTRRSKPSKPSKPAKRAKRLTTGQLKKKVWTEFSRFIRTRGADEQGFNECVTCGIRKHWKELQAGHFVRGRLNNNLFDPRGCNPQCYSCNIGKQGNVIPYYRWMEVRFGNAVINELLTQNNETHKWLAGELQQKLDYFKAMNANNPLLQEQQ